MWSQPKLIWTRYVCLLTATATATAMAIKRKYLPSRNHHWLVLAITITSRSRSSAAGEAEADGPVALPWKALCAQSSIRFIWVWLLWLRIVVAVVVCLDLYRQLVIIDCCAASSSCSLWLKFQPREMHYVLCAIDWVQLQSQYKYKVI